MSENPCNLYNICVKRRTAQNKRRNGGEKSVLCIIHEQTSFAYSTRHVHPRQWETAKELLEEKKKWKRCGICYVAPRMKRVPCIRQIFLLFSPRASSQSKTAPGFCVVCGHRTTCSCSWLRMKVWIWIDAIIQPPTSTHTSFIHVCVCGIPESRSNSLECGPRKPEENARKNWR